MGAESSGAENFLSSFRDTASREEALQASEGSFEKRATRQFLKRFNLNAKGWGASEIEADRLSHLDEICPTFPVRLGSQRIKATQTSGAPRGLKHLGFHEVTPGDLFRPDRFRQLQVFKAFELLREDQSVDARSVGLVFPCVGTLFIIHDWSNAAVLPGISLSWIRGEDSPDEVLTVETFDLFLDRVADSWRP